MGANAQTAVPTFTASQVLTAAQQNQINTGIPVFATTTTRDAAFGGSNKALAQGQYCFIEATNATQYYNGSAWVTNTSGALTLIQATTIGSGVSSVAISNAFSATYDNYLLTMSNCTWSANDQAITFILTGSTASYYSNLVYGLSSTGAVTDLNRSNAASAYIAITDANKAQNFAINIFNPFAAAYTNWSGTFNGYLSSGIAGGQHQVATSYTGFTIAAVSGATLTGGTIRVFGYSNS